MKRKLAVVIYIVQNNQALLVYGQKEKAPHYQKWNGAGGVIEDSDASPEAAAIRETQEETGYTPQDLELKATILVAGIYPDKEFLLYLYRATQCTGELQPRAGEGAAAWFSIVDGLPQAELMTGDHAFLPRIIKNEPYFEGKVLYQGPGKFIKFQEGSVS